MDLFDKLISPIILNYGSEVWGFAKADNIERVHLQFCKKLLSVKQCTQNDFVYGEIGRCSFQLTRYRNIIKYWLKILHCSEMKYVRIIYNMLFNDCITFPNKVTWVTLLRDLLGNLGFMDVWLQQSVGDRVLLLNLVKQRLTDQFIQNWNSRLNDSNRALFYRNFSFGYKNYLLANSDLHSLDSDYLLIVSKLKLGDGLDQMQFLLKRDAVLHVIHWKTSFILF